ncbi:ankyrin repeat protein [Trichonephila inaurata madagascariensis]|uniref:Ankyrin repeat protein n=1 Tax=Trichonephila inaurata madagascariensis TaxID=2747483 RepID=A0A8X6WNY5_9ARAC|nr:ankyrin repeat protein [Trichonephila inaurata madagascariensis]
MARDKIRDKDRLNSASIGQGQLIARKESNDNFPSLIQLLKNNDLKESDIKHLLAKGTAVNSRDKYGRTALHYSVHNPRPDYSIVKALLDRGVDVNIRDYLGGTALHAAAATNSGSSESQNVIVIELIKWGANVNAKDCLNCTPLCAAMFLNNYDIVKILLRNGARAHKTGFTSPLIVAVMNKNVPLAIIKMLLRAGANPCEQDCYGKSVLHYALKYHCPLSIFEVLLNWGADVNAYDKYGNTLLHCMMNKCLCNNLCLIHIPQQPCYDNYYVSQVLVLIHNGANVNAMDKKKCTPLHLAVINSSCPLYIIMEMLRKGNVNAQSCSGASVLINAVQTPFVNTKVIFELLYHGADPNIKDKQGLSALHYAVKNEYCEVVVIRKLLEHIPNVNLLWDNFKRTPLHFAACYGKCILSHIKELLIHGAHIHALDSDEKSPLHYAIKNTCCNFEILEELLKYSDPDLFVVSPLMCAIENPHDPCKVIEKLLLRGFKINQKDFQNDTILNIAFKNPHFNKKIIMYLLKNGACVNEDSYTYDMTSLWSKAIHNICMAYNLSRDKEILQYLKFLIKYAVLHFDADDLLKEAVINDSKENSYITLLSTQPSSAAILPAPFPSTQMEQYLAEKIQ